MNGKCRGCGAIFDPCDGGAPEIFKTEVFTGTLATWTKECPSCRKTHVAAHHNTRPN